MANANRVNVQRYLFQRNGRRESDGGGQATSIGWKEATGGERVGLPHEFVARVGDEVEKRGVGVEGVQTHPDHQHLQQQEAEALVHHLVQNLKSWRDGFGNDQENCAGITSSSLLLSSFFKKSTNFI